LLRGADLYGGSASDRLQGTPYADFLQGGRGPDKMLGGPKNDYIDGVDGIAGNDVLDGGQGIDRCVGDEGDTFRYCDGKVVEVPVPSNASALTKAGH
jgi:Ca2+-binding RTX toxin-like protein